MVYEPMYHTFQIWSMYTLAQDYSVFQIMQGELCKENDKLSKKIHQKAHA